MDWLTSLQGRLTILILAAILLAQIISLTVLVPQRERLENENRQRMFFREAVETYRLFADTPAENWQRIANEAGMRGSFYWIAPQSSVPTGASLKMESLPDVASQLRQLSNLDIRVRWYDDPRPIIQRYWPSPQPVIPPATREGLPPPPPNVSGTGAYRPPPPSQFADGSTQRPPGPPPVPRSGGADDTIRLRTADSLDRSTGPPNLPDGFPGPPRPVNGPPQDIRGWTDVGPIPPPPLQDSLLWSMPGMPEAPEAPVQWRLAVQLPDGQWLNGAIIWTPGGPPWLTAVLGQAGVTAGLMLVLVIITVSLATRRLKALALHADRLGRGEDTEPLAEDGPNEIKQVVRAFNTMNVRLRRFIESRTKMLGAISHDLRTPITALRIRAEFIEDEENRERMMATLEEMKNITEATLTLAKEDSVSEATKNVDLTTLVESIEDDLTDAGQEVSCDAERGVTLACRPHSLKRAIRNLAENGVKYGKRARISMKADPHTVTVLIDDDGPGIPEEKRDQVFMPFVRLEESRSKETGGVGLGLAICRSIVHSHGGDLKMDNRPEGGLRVTVRLPRNGGELIEADAA